jgi:hypothetical protein
MFFKKKRGKQEKKGNKIKYAFALIILGLFFPIVVIALIIRRLFSNKKKL